ncbi:hypothetical protein EAF04_004591 [Stromatinia cepivora]|nr:hypothetical protein EAF04_004591 [Stromatinia cepivora]
MPSSFSIAIVLTVLKLVSFLPVPHMKSAKNGRRALTPFQYACFITDFDMACSDGVFLDCNSEAPYSMTITIYPMIPATMSKVQE